MDLPQDITSCHRMILDMASLLEGLKPQLEGYIQQIEAQGQQILKLEAKVKELESQIKQNSRNSSRPPSAGLFRTKPAFPRNSGGKIGGKFGHDGDTLKMVENTDLIVAHQAGFCAKCGKIHTQEQLSLRGRRQVFDIPAPKIEVTEHQVFDWTCCECAHKNSGEFPGEVSAPAQYGFRIQTVGVLFNNAYNIPRNKVQMIFEDLFGLHLNESTLQNHNNVAYTQLEPEEKHIKSKLLQSNLLHADETGFYIGKDRYWEHVASDEQYTHLFVHAKRGEAAHQGKQSILPDFQNWLMHDCWASYFLFKGCKHAICGAHLLRELTALVENGSVWAKKCHELLLELYKRTEKGQQSLPEKEHAAVLVNFQKILSQADKEEPPPIQNPRGKPKKTKGRNLFDRLKKHTDAVLAFAFYKKVPFTNNQAERDIRPTKTKMKVSGCFRTIEGANTYARVQGFVSTVRKLQFNPFNELYTVLSGGIPDYRLKTS